MNDKVKLSIPIVCVSLLSAAGARMSLNENLLELKKDFPGRDYELYYFDAINGKELSPSMEYLLMTWISGSKQSERSLTAPEVGCMLSHLIVWSKFLLGEYGDSNHLIILEDDVSTTQKFVDGMLQIEKHPPDFAFLASFPDGNNRKIVATQGDGVAALMLGPRYNYTRTCAYLVSKKSARSLLIRQINSPYIADNWEHLLDDNSQFLYPIFQHPQVDLSNSTIELERRASGQPKAPRWTRYKRRLTVIKLRFFVFFNGSKYKKLSDFL